MAPQRLRLLAQPVLVRRLIFCQAAQNVSLYVAAAYLPDNRNSQILSANSSNIRLPNRKKSDTIKSGSIHR